MDAAEVVRGHEKAKLLTRLAELLVEEQRAAGTFDRTPHFSRLEDASHALGREVARSALAQAAREATASADDIAACPQCGRSCRIKTKTRTLQGMDGAVEVMEPVSHCPACRRDFFPST